MSDPLRDVLQYEDVVGVRVEVEVWANLALTARRRQ